MPIGRPFSDDETVREEQPRLLDGNSDVERLLNEALSFPRGSQERRDRLAGWALQYGEALLIELRLARSSE